MVSLGAIIADIRAALTRQRVIEGAGIEVEETEAGTIVSAVPAVIPDNAAAPPVTVTWDATEEEYTVTCQMLYRDYWIGAMEPDVFVFPAPEPSTTAIIRLWVQPAIEFALRTANSLVGLTYSIEDGSITVTDSDTLECVKTCSISPHDQAVVDIEVDSAGNYAVYRSMFHAVYSTFQGYPVRNNSHYWYARNAPEPPDIIYSEGDPGELIWRRPGGTDNSSISVTRDAIATVNVPVSTSAAPIHIYGGDGGPAQYLALSDQTDATHWSYQIGTITTDANGRVTAWTMDHWNPPACPWIMSSGWSGSWVNAEGDTVTVVKGLITDVS